MTKLGRPKEKNAKRKTLTIRVNSDQHKKILKYAESHNITITDAVWKGLSEIIDF